MPPGCCWWGEGISSSAPVNAHAHEKTTFVGRMGRSGRSAFYAAGRRNYPVHQRQEDPDEKLQLIMLEQRRITLQASIDAYAMTVKTRGDKAGMLMAGICAALLTEVVRLSSESTTDIVARSVVAPGTHEIAIAGYVAESVWESAPIVLNGQRLVSKNLYEVVAGQDVLREDATVLFNPLTGVFAFSLAYGLPTAKLVFRTE